MKKLSAKQRKKRREKMARRKVREDWGSTLRVWSVTMRLDGKRVTVDVQCPGPVEAAKLALWENRDYVLKNTSVDRVKVEVRHDHYGLIEKGIYEIPAEDWKKLAPAPTQDAPRKTGKDEALSAAAVACLYRRRDRLLREQMKDDYEKATGKKADPKFKTDDLEGLPDLSFVGKEA